MPTGSGVLDVRDLPPRVRHPKIFETFDALAPGTSFLLINDHDPRPLFYQFQFERAATFGWRYLEEGPETWRVEITKLGSATADASQTVRTVGEAVPESRRVLLDVREDIRRGAEPFARIMGAVEALEADQVLVLRAPFEPAPLYGVLGKRGFAHSTERRNAEDWWVTFYRDAAATGSPAAPSSGPAAAEITLDVRGLEPPEPMLRVLESLDRLPVGGELVVLHERRPMFLYPQLDERGFVHETDAPAAGVVRIRIRRPAG